MDEPDQIHLHDHVVMADIGAFRSERGREQRLRFALTVDLAQRGLGAADDVDAVLSYDVLTGAVASALAERRYDLLETLAERVAALVLGNAGAARVVVRVEKLDRVPGALGVTLTRRRSAGAPHNTAGGAAEPSGGPPVVLFHGTDIDLAPGPLLIVPDALPTPLPPGGHARRVALLALDQAAWVLAARLRLEVADSRTELDHAVAQRAQVVWAPYRMTADLAGLPADPLRLAMWLAQQIGAARLDAALPPDADLPPPPPGLAVRRL